MAARHRSDRALCLAFHASPGSKEFKRQAAAKILLIPMALYHDLIQDKAPPMNERSDCQSVGRFFLLGQGANKTFHSSLNPTGWRSALCLVRELLPQNIPVRPRAHCELATGGSQFFSPSKNVMRSNMGPDCAPLTFDVSRLFRYSALRFLTDFERELKPFLVGKGRVTCSDPALRISHEHWGPFFNGFRQITFSTIVRSVAFRRAVPPACGGEAVEGRAGDRRWCRGRAVDGGGGGGGGGGGRWVVGEGAAATGP